MTAVTSSAMSVSRGKQGEMVITELSPLALVSSTRKWNVFPRRSHMCLMVQSCFSWQISGRWSKCLFGSPASKVEAIMAEGCSQSGACKGVTKTDGREDAACKRGWSQPHWNTAVCGRGWLHNPVPASWTMLAFSQGWELESRQPGGNLWMQTEQSSWWKAVSSAKKVLILIKKKNQQNTSLHWISLLCEVSWKWYMVQYGA